MRQMKFDERKFKKMTLNMVGFNRVPSKIIGKMVMPVSSRGRTAYSTMMVGDTDSTFH